MKASKFTEAQIAVVLKQAEDGVAVAEVWLNPVSTKPAAGPMQHSRSQFRYGESQIYRLLGKSSQV